MSPKRFSVCALVAALALLVAGCSSGGGKHASPTTTVKSRTQGTSTPPQTDRVYPIAFQPCAGVGIGVQFSAATPEEELKMFVTPSGGNLKDWKLTARSVNSATFDATKPNKLDGTDGLASVTITRHGGAWGGLLGACVGPPFPPFSDAQVV